MIEEILEETLNEEIARELIMEQFGDVDEDRFIEAFIKAKGNGWDASVLYALIELAKEIK